MPHRGDAVPALPAGFAGKLIAWQGQHGRHGLPWQGTRDPYRVWVSEVMLQQTQVATVLAYYPRFLARFPDVRALAAALLDDVLAAWSGLGYYRRARYLHQGALAVVAQHGGVFPATSIELMTLPGIGRSTAAAIAAFCFDERAAILDGNVKRVLTRVLGFSDDLAEARHEKRLWALAEGLLPQQGMAPYTQALMDLGATLCSVREPRCTGCPAARLCVARRQGRIHDYPKKTRRLRRGHRSHSLLWLRRGSRLWLVQRPATGVWAGLWSFAEFESVDLLQALTAGWPGQGEALQPFEHALTHFDWTLAPCRWTLPSRLSAARVAAVVDALAARGRQGRWFERDEALQLALPAPIRKLIDNR